MDQNYTRITQINPHFDGFMLLALSWSIDVEVEAVLTLVAEVGQQTLEILETSPGHALECCSLVTYIRQSLRAHRAEPVSRLHTGPQRTGHRRHKPQHPRGWRGVRHSTEHFHRVQVSVLRGHYDPRHLTILSPDYPAGH